MYYKYRKSPSSGRSATLRLTQRGVLIMLFEDGNIKSEIFFDFSAVVFVEAASFAPVKTSSERKPKAFFLPIEQDGAGKLGGGAVHEKHAFLVERNFHFLVATSHPPLVVCVVRRPQGVKALDCHVFALDTIENALHISGLIASAQTSPGTAGMAGGVAVAGAGRGGATFDKSRGGGDVIRTEYGEYSVYRGSQPPPHDAGMVGHGPPRMMAGGGGGGGAGGMGPPGGRNGYLGGGVPGGIVLTQDNFMSDSSSDHHQHQLQHPQQYLQPHQAQYTADVIPRGSYGGGGGGGNIRGPGPQHLSGYHNRPPDVIMHARPMSGDVGGDPGFSQNSAHDRSFGSIITGGGGSSDHSSGVRMRYEEGGGNQSRHSGSRGSGGQISPRGPVDSPSGSGGGGGGGYIPPGARPMFPGGPLPPSEAARARYSPPPPTSPRGHSAEVMRGGPAPGQQEIFSASNRESREMEDESEHQMVMGGKPVAKVPPHFKAGIKVLPSDFRMVKLKHKALSEDKRADSISDESYDNNKEMVDRYREMQKVEQGSRHSGEHYPDVAASAAHMRGHGIHQDHSRDFRSRWDEDDDNSTRTGAGVFYGDRSSGGTNNGDLNYSQEHRNGNFNNSNNSSSNRYSSPGDYGHDFRSQPSQQGHVSAGVKSQSAYSITSGRGDNSSNSDSASNDPARFKDLEIANMFSNFRLDDNVNNPKNNNNGYSRRRDDLLVSSADGHGFENGLGYLP